MEKVVYSGKALRLKATYYVDHWVSYYLAEFENELFFCRDTTELFETCWKYKNFKLERIIFEFGEFFQTKNDPCFEECACWKPLTDEQIESVKTKKVKLKSFYKTKKCFYLYGLQIRSYLLDPDNRYVWEERFRNFNNELINVLLENKEQLKQIVPGFEEFLTLEVLKLFISEKLK